MRSQLAVTASAVLLAGALGSGAAVSPTQAEPAQATQSTVPAALTAPPVDATGRTVLVYFWGSWCKPCREDMPALRRVQKSGTTVLGGVREESLSMSRMLLHSSKVQFPNFLDSDGRVAAALFGRSDAYPTAVLIRDGVVVARHAGPVRSWSELPALLAFNAP